MPNRELQENELGAYHLADQPKYFEPLRTNNFIALVHFDTLGGFDETYFGTDASKAQEVIKYSVVSFKPPHPQVGTLPIKRGNGTVNFAGVATYGTDNLVINDYYGGTYGNENNNSKSMLQAWFDLVFNAQNEKVGRAYQYKTTIDLMEYLPDNTLVRTWTLYGCWPSQIDESEKSNESNSQNKVTATIVYDRALETTNAVRSFPKNIVSE